MRVAFQAGVVAALALSFSSCVSATQQQDAERGLRIACAALVESMTDGVDVPRADLVREACDVERTKQLVHTLVLEFKGLELAPLDWDPAASPGAGSDAGAP